MTYSETQDETRRIAVCKMLVKGMSFNEIAPKLGMSVDFLKDWRKTRFVAMHNISRTHKGRADAARAWLQEHYPNALELKAPPAPKSVGKTCRRYIASERAECGKLAKKHYCADCEVALNYSTIAPHEARRIVKEMGFA